MLQVRETKETWGHVVVPVSRRDLASGPAMTVHEVKARTHCTRHMSLGGSAGPGVEA